MIPVHPDNLREVWDFVREGLLCVQERATDGWIPEDVYMAIKNGHSTLHIARESGENTGFVVVTPTRDFRGLKLHIWAAYCTEGNAVRKYEPDIIEMTKAIGARRFCFESTRKGWAKLYPTTMTTYEKELN